MGLIVHMYIYFNGYFYLGKLSGRKYIIQASILSCIQYLSVLCNSKVKGRRFQKYIFAIQYFVMKSTHFFLKYKIKNSY